MAAFKNMYPLPIKQAAAGGNAQVEFLGLPLDARLAGILISMESTATTGASTQAVTPVDQLFMFKNVDCDSDYHFLRSTGRMLHVLNRHMTGFPVASAAQSITATTGGVAARTFFYLPLVDDRAAKPFDTAIPVPLIREKTLNFAFAASLSVTLTQTVTFTAAQVVCTAILVPSAENPNTVPAKTRIAFEDWSQKTANLQPGYFTHLGIYDESDLAVTNAEYSQMSLSLDGAQIIDRISVPALAARYNQAVGADATFELSYQPGATMVFLPLITAPDKYQLGQLMRADVTCRADIDSGSLSSARYYYRQVMPATQAMVNDAAARFGFNPDTVQVKVKTANGEPVTGSANRVKRHNRILPKEFVA